MQYQSFGDQVVRTMKKVVRITLMVIVLMAIAFLCLVYWGVYDEGMRAGTVLRISKKGMIFKTFEGQLSVHTFASFKEENPTIEAFDFSVATDDEEVISTLQDVALSGERVNVHYVARYATFPWRGDTKYFITKVERVVHEP